MLKKIAVFLFHLILIGAVVFSFITVRSNYDKRNRELTLAYNAAIADRDRIISERNRTVEQLEGRNQAIRDGLAIAVELSQSIADRYKRFYILIDAIAEAISR